MHNLKAKKLLILGAYRSEIEIVEKARDMGIYTIVTDNHTDWNLAPAKSVADEAWDISWSDIETLKGKCILNNVDGCIAGFSEKRIMCAQKLCKQLGVPFYANNSKLSIICNKNEFKNACIKCGIKTASTFNYGENIKFPVIVKPADNGGSKGITICYTEEELEIAYRKAMEFSDNNTVVIEEYIIADEIMVYYTVHDGVAEISAMCDRYMHKFDKNITQLPIGYYFPSKYLNIFYKYNDEKFKKLISCLGIENGLIAFQAFVVDKDVIPFDPTYRLDGTMAYHITYKMNNVSVLEMLINYSLLGTMGEFSEIARSENPRFLKPCFELPILLRKGIISNIVGLEQLTKIKEIIHIYQGHVVGERMLMEADFSQMLCRIQICAEDDTTLKKIIDQIYDIIKVYDENGDDMVIGKVATNKVGGIC